MSSTRIESMSAALANVLADKVVSLTKDYGELTLVISSSDLSEVSSMIRDHADLDFDTLIDLCGIDYYHYGGSSASESKWSGRRFAVVYHMLSIKHNCRLRIKTFAENDDLPVVDSVVTIWPTANWFEREAFDLFGIVFNGHPDLRRILTDYGFIGNPFRKDFPLSGNVEMIYDEQQQRVIYQPVSIEPREVTPHVIREDHYGDN